MKRELYMVPPKEADTKNLWKLKKCAYGLSDAGRHRHLKVVEELKAPGASQLKLDLAVFAWHDPNGVCCGIMATHVDDFVYGGTADFLAVFAWHDPNGVCCGIMATHVDDFVYGGTADFINSVIPQLRSTFQISSEESSGMKYVGISIKQSARGISLSTDAYCLSLREISDLGPDKHRPRG